MAPPNISRMLATEDDAPALASIITRSFSACDPAYPLVWGGAPEGTHERLALKVLFSPVQQDGRVTLKAVDGEQLLGFATWKLPKPKAETVADEVDAKLKRKEAGLPDIPDVNMELFRDKVEGMNKFHDRDVDPSKDISLSLLFVDPAYQHRGIGSSLLQWGMQKADELGAKIWLTSTPNGFHMYESNGWVVKEIHNIDLGNHGGKGDYVRRWMVREPRASG